MNNCRCCNTQKDVHKSIHTKYEDGATYAEFIEKIASIKITQDDGFHQGICDYCFHEVTQMFDYGSIIQCSNEELRNKAETTSVTKLCRCCADPIEGEELDACTLYDDYKGGYSYGEFMSVLSGLEIEDEEPLPCVLCHDCYGALNGLIQYSYYSIYKNDERLKKLKKQCRICLKRHVEKSIHDKFKGGRTYSEFIQKWADIKIGVHDGYPQGICNMCFYEVTNMFNFCSSARDAFEEWKKQLEAGISNQQQCRFCSSCTTEKGDYPSLFDKNRNMPPLSAFLEKVTDLKIHRDDGFPQVICVVCYSQTRNMAQFCYNIVKKTERDIKDPDRGFRRFWNNDDDQDYSSDNEYFY